jgi:hypothetical protein
LVNLYRYSSASNSANNSARGGQQLASNTANNSLKGGLAVTFAGADADDDDDKEVDHERLSQLATELKVGLYKLIFFFQQLYKLNFSLP